MAAKEPLWTQEEALAFEVSHETISHLMSICTSEIAEEERKAKPDRALIAGLEDRFTNLHRESARLKDHADIARVTQVYGLMVRAWNHRQDMLAAE